MSTLSIFDAARDAPERIAVIDQGRALSFREAAERTAPLASALLSTRPPALALTPRADTESLLWLYAALATGTPVLTLHVRATPNERRDAMARARARETPVPTSEAFDEATLPPSPDSATLAFIPTSGSTGTPRLVELSRRAVIASATASAQNLGWEATDRWLLCLPLAHTGGLSIVTRCLLARQSVLLFEPRASGVLARIDELQRVAESATLMSLVPSVLAALLDAGFQPPAGLRAVLVGGAGCSPALAERAYATRVPLLTSYGLTETASQVVTRRYADRFAPLPVRRGVVSAGHPLPGVELQLTGGALAIRAPSLFSGYLGETGASLDANGFLLTNDQAELGADGELYVRGRLDDVIVSGGENIDPLEVEAALSSLPGVKAACVFGTASPRFGQVVTAVLVTTDARLGDPAHLASLLANRLARHKLPRLVRIMERLPLTISGKVDRRVIQEQVGTSLVLEPRS
jgi:o-succinylbenzoate---CoA ligase